MYCTTIIAFLLRLKQLDKRWGANTSQTRGCFGYCCGRLLEVDFVWGNRHDRSGRLNLWMLMITWQWRLKMCWCHAGGTNHSISRWPPIPLKPIVATHLYVWMAELISLPANPEGLGGVAYRKCSLEFFLQGEKLLLKRTENLWSVSWWGFCCSFNHFF